MINSNQSQNDNSNYGRKVVVEISPDSRRILLEAARRMPPGTPRIVYRSIRSLCGSMNQYAELFDAEGFINKRDAGSEIAQILGAVAFALKGDFDRQSGVSYREKYPYANRSLREALISMLRDKTVDSQMLHNVIEDTEYQCSTYNIPIDKRGRDQRSPDF